MTFDTMGLSEVKLEDGARGLGLDTRSESDPGKGTEGSLAACTTVGCTRAPSSATRRQVSLVPVKKVHTRRWPFATKTRGRTHCRKKNASGYPPTPDVHMPPRRSRKFINSDVKQETVDTNLLEPVRRVFTDPNANRRIGRPHRNSASRRFRNVFRRNGK